MTSLLTKFLIAFLPIPIQTELPCVIFTGDTLFAPGCHTALTRSESNNFFHVDYYSEVDKWIDDLNKA